jgi:hypothetical protein
MQIEQRADGWYFRFVLVGEGFVAQTQWFGPFDGKDLIGAIKAVHRYGFDRVEKTVYVDGEPVSFVEEKYLSEVFPYPLE